MNDTILSQPEPVVVGVDLELHSRLPPIDD